MSFVEFAVGGGADVIKENVDVVVSEPIMTVEGEDAETEDEAEEKDEERTAEEAVEEAGDGAGAEAAPHEDTAGSSQEEEAAVLTTEEKEALPEGNANDSEVNEKDSGNSVASEGHASESET